MSSSTNPRFLNRDGFLGGEAFEDDFETDDLFVANPDGPAFVDG